MRIRFTRLQKLFTGVGIGALAVTFFTNSTEKAEKYEDIQYSENLHDTSYSSQVFDQRTDTHEKRQKWIWDWDHMHPEGLLRPKRDASAKEHQRYEEEKKKMSKTGTHHIVLIRHGEYSNEHDIDKLRNLTARGREQALLTGKRLKEYDINWTRMIVSTMQRARETAEIIHREIDINPKKVEYSALLREGAPSSCDPQELRESPYNIYRDGARIETAFRHYIHRAGPHDPSTMYTLIVCHSNVIRYFVCRALQFPETAWLRLSLNHASITWLTIKPNGTVTLRCLGESGHIPANLITVKTFDGKKA